MVWKAPPPHLEYEIFIGYCIELCAYILYITRYSGFIDTFHGNKFLNQEGIFIRSCTEEKGITFHKKGSHTFFFEKLGIILYFNSVFMIAIRINKNSLRLHEYGYLKY